MLARSQIGYDLNNQTTLLTDYNGDGDVQDWNDAYYIFENGKNSVKVSSLWRAKRLSCASLRTSSLTHNSINAELGGEPHHRRILQPEQAAEDGRVQPGDRD